MKLLLTSSGISNASIRRALDDLLGKPVEESTALFVPTAVHPFPASSGMAWRAITGEARSPLAGLGWRSLGVLELTALPTIDRGAWAGAVEAADALLVWGGDPLYLAHWMRRSGLAEVLAGLRDGPVYVGVSAGSMAAATTLGETYTDRPATVIDPLPAREVALASPGGEIRRTFVSGPGAGFVDFAIIPHLDHEDHPDASAPNAAWWASMLPVATYAIDDESAVRVVDDAVDVVSEGHWEHFAPS